MKLKLQRDIFIAFFRSSILGYGGGPSTIPLVHTEVVKNYKWLSDEEFSDILALGNTLPGPINTKMAGYIGYRLGGTVGLINATLATILPTVVLMIILITWLTAFRDSPRVQGMTQAVTPVVGVMMLTLAISFLKQSKKGLGWLKAGIFSTASLLIIAILHIHPGLLIGAILLFCLLKRTKDTVTSKEA